jgi:hypothetical protein
MTVSVTFLNYDIRPGRAVRAILDELLPASPRLAGSSAGIPDAFGIVALALSHVDPAGVGGKLPVNVLPSRFQWSCGKRGGQRIEREFRSMLAKHR